MNESAPSAIRRDVPVPSQPSEHVWGSDAIAALLRALEIPYVILNPGASFRGLHDSIVNYLGNERPQMAVVLHEEHAVAIAHGYTKVTGKPLAAIVHSNVGLMHATMAIFNAWCDRVPVLVLGATGPVDAAKRRPWIDWIHSAQDQGALVRDYTKWDAQPASVPATYEALLRAAQIASTAPQGPVYVCLDAAVQEAKLERLPPLPQASRHRAPLPAHPAPALIDQAAAWLSKAERPLILAGRVSRSERGWQERVDLAERLDADVLTDLRAAAAFPTDHPLHAAAPGYFLSPTAAAALKAADVVLSLDWVDLAGTLRQAWGTEPVGSRIIQVSVDQHSHRGWSLDHQGLPPIDLYLLAEPEPVVTLLGQTIAARPKRPRAAASAKTAPIQGADGSISLGQLAGALQRATAGQPVCLIRLPLGWSGELLPFRHPLDYLGMDGGGGVGSGPAMAIGAALALTGSGRLPIALLGDGDTLMGVSALWTAANLGVPLLVIVCNNRSFFNDEVHQERVAKERKRPVENRWIGQRIGNPDPDLALLARGQGLTGIGPVSDPRELDATLEMAVAAVRSGESVVLDVRIAPGYSPSMAAGMTRSQSA